MRILLVRPGALGDVILTLPVLDALRAEYPQALITVMVGPRASEVFKDNPYIEKLIIYNKYAQLRYKIRLFSQLKKEHFDLVVDLRNTLYGALLPARFRTSPFLRMPAYIRHMREKNLYRLMRALRQKEPLVTVNDRFLYINQKDEDYINNLLQENGIVDKEKIVIVSPAAGGRTRRWDKGKFTGLCQRIAKDYTLILIGRKQDKSLTEYIKVNCTERVFDFSGLTNLGQLAFLLERACLVVTCDTGILHLASYLDIPIVALFGPSDEQRYGPWSRKFRIITAQISCRPCSKPDCRFGTVECMQKVSVNEVLDSIDALLKS